MWYETEMLQLCTYYDVVNSKNLVKFTLGYKYNRFIYPGSFHLFPLTIPVESIVKLTSCIDYVIQPGLAVSIDFVYFNTGFTIGGKVEHYYAKINLCIYPRPMHRRIPQLRYTTIVCGYNRRHLNMVCHIVHTLIE